MEFYFSSIKESSGTFFDPLDDTLTNIAIEDSNVDDLRLDVNMVA